MEAACYYSPSGEENTYVALPFKMRRQHFFDYLNGIYKQTTMESFRNCSTFPMFEKKFTPPLEKRAYTVNKCLFLVDGFPNHLQEGYYKIIIIASGDLGAVITYLAKVEPSHGNSE